LLELDVLLGGNLEKISSVDSMKDFAAIKIDEFKNKLASGSGIPSGWLMGVLIFLILTARMKLSN
jgi:hypothetical protein